MPLSSGSRTDSFAYPFSFRFSSTFRFKKILRQNGLPENLNVHSLRHTNASLLIAQGVDVRTAASLPGHSQASTTLDIYAHAFDKKKREAQEKLGKVRGM